MALDFEIIRTDDPTKLIIADLSDWTGLTGAEADILCPECDTPETVLINKNLVNTFTMADLAVTNDRLADGIYEITFRDSAGTTTKTRTYLRTAYLRLLRDKLFLSLGLNDSSKLSIVDLYIDAAYANLREGDISKTKYYYNAAKSKIEKLQCK